MKIKSLQLTDTELRIVEGSLKDDGDARLRNAMVAAARHENDTASEFLQEGMVLHSLSEKVRLALEGKL